MMKFLYLSDGKAFLFDLSTQIVFEQINELINGSRVSRMLDYSGHKNYYWTCGHTK